MTPETRRALAPLLDRLAAMESRLAHMETAATLADDPYKPIFLAKRKGTDKTWQEQTVNAGKVEEFPDGRTCSASDDGTSQAIAPTGATVFMEIPDGDAHRYVDIGPRYFPVTLAQDGGGDGSSSTQAGYTYTVTDEGGTQIGTFVAPEKLRPNGRFVVATKGQAYFDKNGNLKLWDTDERPRTGVC